MIEPFIINEHTSYRLAEQKVVSDHIPEEMNAEHAQRKLIKIILGLQRINIEWSIFSIYEAYILSEAAEATDRKKYKGVCKLLKDYYDAGARKR